MSIHHATQQKAEKLGLIITEDAAKFPDFGSFKYPANTVAIHWPQFNLWAFGIGAKPAMAEAEALIAVRRNLIEDGLEPTIVNCPRDPFLILVFSGKGREHVALDRQGSTPQDTLAAFDKDGVTWLSTTVPEEGDAAFKQGFTAADNPWRPRDADGEIVEDDDGDEEVNEKADQWDAAFDAAADEDAEEAEPDQTGSVVSERYRQRYKEEGHPNHCGDWLAVVLNNIVGDTKHLNVEALDELAKVNGVNNTKYDRSNPGWQGRLRMTTRNLIAPVVFKTGVLKLASPVDGQQELRAPAEWTASQRFKKPAPSKPNAE
jgi:hypothetical protein